MILIRIYYLGTNEIYCYFSQFWWYPFLLYLHLLIFSCLLGWGILYYPYKYSIINFINQWKFFVNDSIEKFIDTCNVHTKVAFTLWNIKVTLIFKMTQSNTCYCKEKSKEEGSILFSFYTTIYSTFLLRIHIEVKGQQIGRLK